MKTYPVRRSSRRSSFFPEAVEHGDRRRCVSATVRRGQISHQCQFQRFESVHSTVTLKRVDIYRPAQPNVLSGLCDPPSRESYTSTACPGPRPVRFADNSYPSILILGPRCTCSPSEIKRRRTYVPWRASDCYRSRIPDPLSGLSDNYDISWRRVISFVVAGSPNRIDGSAMGSLRTLDKQRYFSEFRCAFRSGFFLWHIQSKFLS